MLKKSVVTVVILVIIVVLVIGVVVFLKIKNSGTFSNLPVVKVTEEGLCYNSEYQTEFDTYAFRPYTPEKIIVLTNESEDKLKEALKKQGDSALKAISNLTCLEKLDLETQDCGVSNISALKDLKNLRMLMINNNGSGPQISDIFSLKNMEKMENLILPHNLISDISVLSNMKNLRDLFLYNNKISDTSPLSRLTNLESLNLDWNPISDISPLKKLTNLKTLSLVGEIGNKKVVSNEDYQTLKEALPNTEIKHQY
jgi:hypothetical protein